MSENKNRKYIHEQKYYRQKNDRSENEIQSIYYDKNKNCQCHSKMMNIYCDRMKCAESFINNVESISLIGNKDIKIKMNIYGLYSELTRYLFFSNKEIKLIDDPDLLPKLMYIYMSDIEINPEITGKIINLLCPYNLIKSKTFDRYKIYDKREIELLYNVEDSFDIEYAIIYRFENSENKDTFDIILVFHYELVKQINFNICIRPNGKCILDSLDLYKNNEDIFLKLSNDHIFVLLIFFRRYGGIYFLES